MKRKEAIEVIKKNYPHVTESGTHFEEALRTLVPELKESEDERIRRYLIKFVSEYMCFRPSGIDFNRDTVLAWLERHKTSEEALQYLRENHSSSEMSDFQAAMNIAVAKAYDKGYNDGLEKQGETFTKKDVDDAYLKGITDTKNEIEKQYEANSQIRKDIATFIFNYRGVIKDRAKWIDYLGIKVLLKSKVSRKKTLCDKCKKEQPSHSCQDITALGRCALEMQGEQKPTDKVEPKFHEGEWIANGDYTWQIVEVKPLDYILQSQDGNTVDDTISHVDEQFHSFTIEDAKAGDVLIDNYNNVVMYQEPCSNLLYHSFCFGSTKVFVDSGGSHFIEGTYPATKEQRDLLFQKMKEAGYEWDAEKKELKKIEQKPAESNDIKSVLLVHDEILNNLLERYKTSATFKTLIVNLKNWWNNTRIHLLSFNIGQNLAWSEEDERMIDNIIFELEENQENISGVGYKIDWLKSLKERVQPQTKQKWSEEDKQYLLVCKNALYKYQSSNQWDAGIIIRWLENKLKSFRPQNYWKPSDEQVTWLYRAADDASKDSRMKQVLNELLSDLKKLREE